jgi:hypothetical protein
MLEETLSQILYLHPQTAMNYHVPPRYDDYTTNPSKRETL